MRTRYAQKQRVLLRALADLAANERPMYELDTCQDHVMTVLKLALVNLAMWTREHCFPATYAQATWGRLAPFFHLAGELTSSRQGVSVELRPFNDRQYNRDLLTLCQRVNDWHPHLPDGRRLSFNVSRARERRLSQAACPTATRREPWHGHSPQQGSTALALL
jgi:hypothetical protein